MRQIDETLRRIVLLFLIFVSPTAYCADGVAVDEDWLTLRDISLEILPDSPLDFSKFFPDQATAPMQAIGQNAEGQLQAGRRRQRFLCAPMVLTPPYGGFPTHEQAERYATQLRRAGYNLVRLMHVETILMTGQDRDFNYNQDQLDRFHYFLAALKREGIYWMIDALTSDNGSFGGVQPHRWIEKHELKRRMYFDPEARTHWRLQVQRLFSRNNPYTGIPVIQDSALMGLIVVNEGGLNFLTHVGRAIPPGLTPQLSNWLKDQYSKVEFERRWQQPISKLEDGKLQLPKPNQPSEQMDDVLRFYDALQHETGQWMELQLRQLGFTGLVSGFNNAASTGADRARATFDWVDMHNYHDEAFGFRPGTRIKNTSSYEGGLTYVRGLAAARQAGKAFTVSEYGQPFWNQWRREMVAVPAYAALHDWDAICQHASTAVDYTYAHSEGWKQSIQPYAVGLDPVTRAIETLAALLYRRGDVKVSPAHIDLKLTGPAQEGDARYWGVGAKVMSGALVIKTMTHIADKVEPFTNDHAIGSITPSGEFSIQKQVESHSPKVRSASKKANFTSIVTRLVMPENKTNTELGFFESVTGEISLDTSARRLEIVTPKTVATVLQTAPRIAQLGPLQIKALSVPALVALSSLDGNPLTSSRHMLLVLASDALNTGMRFEDSSRQGLVALGRLPARLQPVSLQFGLMTNGQKIKITPLSMAGKRHEYMIASPENLSIDWRTQSYGPTIFYEIEVE